MYKKLLEKGFFPIYYSNADFLEVTSNKSRLFYRLLITNSDLIKVIFQTLNVFDTYFYTLSTEDLILKIEFTEDLDSCWIYFENEDADAFEVALDLIHKMLNVIPNEFMLEHHDY